MSIDELDKDIQELPLSTSDKLTLQLIRTNKELSNNIEELNANFEKSNKQLEERGL